MLDHFEALDALERHGTTAAAGTALRIGQSAVSKRIAALEGRLGVDLIERRGRRVELTPAGRRLLTQVRAPLAQLRDALGDDGPAPAGAERLTIGVSESILASWGPRALRETLADVGAVHLEIHAHRSPVVVDRVRSGKYLLGLCAGIADTAPDLAVRTVAREPIVLVPAGLRRVRALRGLRVITIEDHAATWQSLRRGLAAAGIEVAARVESFTAIARMAAEGLGHGVVPLGVALAVGLRTDQVRRLKMTRPISIVGRRSLVAQVRVAAFIDGLEARTVDAVEPS